VGGRLFSMWRKVIRPLAEVVRRQFERHLVACKDANVMLAHLAGGIRDERVTVVQRDAIAAIGQHLVDDAHHFELFFLCHRDSFGKQAARGQPRQAAPLRE
jgi:hypothetical protein